MLLQIAVIPALDNLPADFFPADIFSYLCLINIIVYPSIAQLCKRKTGTAISARQCTGKQKNEDCLRIDDFFVKRMGLLTL